MTREKTAPEATELPAEGRVVVLFSGVKCPPCDALKPHLVAECVRRPGTTLVVLTPDLAALPLYRRFNVRSSPTVVYFVNGVELGRFSGGRPAAALTEILNRWNVT